MDVCLVQSSPFRDEKAGAQEGSWLGPGHREVGRRLVLGHRPSTQVWGMSQ